MNDKGKIILVIVLTLIGVLVARQTRLLECVSESLQGIRYLLVWKGTEVKREDIVFIKDHKIKHVPQTQFAKRVLGLPGDMISRNKEAISIGSYQLPLLKQTKDGKPLTPISALYVPKDHAFVAGDHSRSFDSRYEEFGLVPIEKIWGKGIASW